jgi:molybdate transport system substrate-binding protein
MRGPALVLAAVLCAALAGCGGDDGPTTESTDVIVAAAASLTEPLRACAPDGAKFSFAGSDELAAQIRKGAKPGVFAAANATLPRQLYEERLAEQPVEFATNELVVATTENSEIHALDDLAAGAPKLAVGAETVPVGAYTRQVLSRLDDEQRLAIERNIRTEEPDAKGIAGKIRAQAVEAGFVYRTDAQAAGLRVVELPREVRPTVEYGAQVVSPSRRAQAFLDSLVSGGCRDALRKAGFGTP